MAKTPKNMQIENKAYSLAGSYLVFRSGKRCPEALKVHGPTEAAKSGVLTDGREFRANWNNPTQAELDAINAAIRSGDAELQAHDKVRDKFAESGAPGEVER